MKYFGVAINAVIRGLSIGHVEPREHEVPREHYGKRFPITTAQRLEVERYCREQIEKL